MLEFRHVSTGRSSCPVLYRASTSFFPVSLKSRREWPGIGERKQRRPSDGYARRWRHLFVFVSNPSDQVLFGDDFTEPAVIRNEFLDEFMHAMLENIIHVAVLKAIADAAGVALRGALAAIGDADLIEIAHQIAVTAGQRTRQRIVEDQEVRDQPWFQGFAIDPMVGGQRRARAQDRGPLIIIERSADMLFLGQQHMVLHVEDAGGVVGALKM